MTIRIQLDTVFRAEKLRPILYALRPVEKRGLRKSGFWGRPFTRKGGALPWQGGSTGDDPPGALQNNSQPGSALFVDGKCRLLQAGLP